MKLKQYITEAHIPYWEILLYYTSHRGFEEISLVCTPKQMYKLMSYLKGIKHEGFIRGQEEKGLQQSTIGDLMSKWLSSARYNEVFKLRYRKYPGSKGWEWDWDHGISKDRINTILTGSSCKDYHIIYNDADEDEIIETFERFMSTYE